MRNFNFASYDDKFEPGKLTTLAEEVLSGKARKEYTGLSLDELARVPTIYGTLDPRECHVLDLEDEKIYKTSNGNELLGADIKSLTMLMYAKPRSAYVEFARVKQCHQTMYSGAVPLPLLGFKRFRDLNYNLWRGMFEHYASIDPKTFQLVERRKNALEKAFRIDALLGNTLASTKYNSATDQIEWDTKGFGLLLLSSLIGKGWRPNAETLNYLRVKGMGNYKGSFATTYGSARVDNSTDDNIDSDIIKMYNAATTPLRLLITQRWAWYGNHRCDDMICDLQDWDIMPQKHDTITNAFIGLKPQKGTTTGIGAKFGIGKES